MLLRLRRHIGFPSILVVVVTATIAVHALAVWIVATNVARDGVAGDWAAFHTGATLVERGDAGDLYDLDAQSRVQDEDAGGHVALNPYVLPAFVATALSPLASLPVSTTYWLWMCANVVMLASLIAVCWKQLEGVPHDLRLASVGLAAASIPVVSTLMLGQFELLIVACIGASYVLLARGRPALAGAVLAIALIKPQIALPFVAMLLAKRQWPAVGAFACTSGALVLAPAAVLGVHVILDQLAILRTETSPVVEARVNEEVMVNLRGLITSMGSPGGDAAWLIPLAVLGSAAVFSAVRTWRSTPVLHPQSWVLALILPLVASPHVHMQSMVLLVAAGVVYVRARADAGIDTPVRWPAVAFVLATACWLAGIAGLALAALLPLIAFAVVVRRWPQRRGAAITRLEPPHTLIARSA